MNISLSTANGSSSSMSQILVSMSLYLVITVVNSSNTATDISGHSKQAQESQVNVIPSYKLKQFLSYKTIMGRCWYCERKPFDQDQL